MSIKLAPASAPNLQLPGKFNYFSAHTKKISKANNQDTITYTFNSQGYRCDEFENINWSESILALGCSVTQGVGLDDKECWSYRLQEKTSIPVINLGQYGTSLYYHLYNLEILQKYNPRYVIIQMPDPVRFTNFHKNGCEALAWFNTTYKEKFRKAWKRGNFTEALTQQKHMHFMEIWTRDNNHMIYQTFAINYLRLLFPGKIFLFSIAAIWEDLQDTYPVLDAYLTYDDRARDYEHPGPKSNESWADYLSQAIF